MVPIPSKWQKVSSIDTLGWDALNLMISLIEIWPQFSKVGRYVPGWIHTRTVACTKESHEMNTISELNTFEGKARALEMFFNIIQLQQHISDVRRVKIRI